MILGLRSHACYTGTDYNYYTRYSVLNIKKRQALVINAQVLV